MSQVRDALVLKGVPLSACGGVYYLGAPVEVVVAMLLTAQHWYGPVVVYLTQRLPVLPDVSGFDPRTCR